MVPTVPCLGLGSLQNPVIYAYTNLETEKMLCKIDVEELLKRICYKLLGHMQHV